MTARLWWQARWQAWWAARHPPRDDQLLTQRNLYILPSRAGLAFCATLLLLLLASINDQLSLGYLLTFLLAGAGLVSMQSTHANLRGLRLDLKAPPPVHAGQALSLDIRLHNDGAARYGVGLRASGTELAHVDVPAQGHALLQLQLPQPQRGHLQLPRLRIESRFPLGLFGAWSFWQPAARAWVYPAPEADAPAAPPGEADQPQGPGQPGQGEADGLRPYRRGDTPRQILWRKSALALQQPEAGLPLLVREDGAGRASPQWLDLAATRGLPFEQRLSRLTAWVLRAEAGGRPYGLRLGGQALAPALGPEHLQACLQALALAREDGS